MAVKKPEYYTLYSLTCLVNNKVYVGVCRWYHQRSAKHISDLKKQVHGNCYLQQDFNLHGVKSFVFDIIQTYKNKHEATLIEKYYTDVVFRLNKDYCYNILSGGDNVQQQITKINSDRIKSDPEYRDKISKIRINSQTGKKLSDETKYKIRKSRIGKKISEETRQKMIAKRSGGGNWRAKKVVDKNTGKVYDCLKDAINDLGLKYDTERSRMNGYNNVKSILRWL